MRTYSEIIITLVLHNCLGYSVISSPVTWKKKKKRTAVRILIWSWSSPTHKERRIALCWPKHIFGLGIIIESYWPWITFSSPAFGVLILGNMSIHGCMITDTMHLGIIPHINLLSNEGYKKLDEVMDVARKMEKLSQWTWEDFRAELTGRHIHTKLFLSKLHCMFVEPCSSTYRLFITAYSAVEYFHSTNKK